MMHLEAFKPTRTSGTKMIQTYIDFRTYKPISIEPKSSAAWWPRWGRRIFIFQSLFILLINLISRLRTIGVPGGPPNPPFIRRLGAAAGTLFWLLVAALF